MIVGFVGLIGAGKDTAADFLVNFHEFRRESFASSLKDSISNIFGWDRTLLEGRTNESREWREQIDEWWAVRLNLPQLTPRWVLQYWATDVCRNTFHEDIWIASLENKMRKTSDNIVISDVRFPNEIAAIHNAGGIVIRVKRGDDPSWFNDAIEMNSNNWPLSFVAKERIEQLGIHSSETAWIGSNINYVIFNDNTIDDLYNQIQTVIKNPE